MKQELEHKNKLTLLLRWLRGDATRHDEEALEALSQGDPFLAEAFEGYRSLPEGDHAAAVTRLKAKLRQRTQRRRGTVFYLLRAAAVGAVLVAAWVVFQQEKSQPQMGGAGMADAAQKESAPPAEIATESTAEEVAPAPTESAPPAPGQPGANEKKEQSGGQFFLKKDEVTTLQGDELAPAGELRQSTTPAEMDAAVAVMDSTAGPADADDQFVGNQGVAELKSLDEEAAKPAPPAAKRKMADAPAVASGAAIRQITGTVTDENGDPLIGASVLATGTPLGGITNFDGSYSLNVPANVQSLEFSYTGFNTLQVALGTDTRLDVTMNENSDALSEVVVTALGRSDKAKRQQVVSPKPDGGFRKFEKYIRENLRHPDAAAQPRPRRELTIRFRLLADGTLADFAPVGPVAGQAYIDEAIRLLREGPKWKGDPGTEASYTVVFE